MTPLQKNEKNYFCLLLFSCQNRRFHISSYTKQQKKLKQRAKKDKKFNTLSSSFDSFFSLFFHLYIMCLRLLLTIMHIKGVFKTEKSQQINSILKSGRMRFFHKMRRDFYILDRFNYEEMLE